MSHRATPFAGPVAKTHVNRTATAVRTGLLCLVPALLLGCTDPNKPDLAVACALKKCICLSDADGYFARNFQTQTTTEILWTETGDAYCPEDFSLQEVNEKSRDWQYYTP